MRLVRVQEFTDKYHKGLLSLCLLLIIAVDVFVISQRSLHLSDGISSTWWMIIQNEETGAGYKACDPTYVPNCQLTDQVTAIREPVPVFFFAIIGRLTNNSLKAFQFSQLFLNLAICWLIYLLTREFGSRILGLAAAFGWTVYAPSIHNLLHISGDLLAGFFVVGGVLYCIRALKYGRLRGWIFFGLLFGLAVLSRSSTLLMFLVLVFGSVIYLWRSRKFANEWGRPLLAVLLLGLVASPWIVRNEMAFGKPILGTTLVGYNLYRHNAIVTPEAPPHYVGPGEASSEVKSLVAATPELRRPINEARVDEIFQQAALRMIRKYPDEYIELVAFRILPLWFNFGVLDQ
jgi:4-amino-4-deoxy-L-arabinose transferase-like glycosyltransferase